LGLSEPVIEDLTRDALKLLSFELDDLYAILGCQLLAAAPPTRVAHMLVWLVDLRKTESPADEWISRGEKVRNDLQCDGTSFVDSIKEGLRKSLCTKDILDLTGDIDRIKDADPDHACERHIENPAAIESISATLAAMFCNSMLREVCL
jgi:hypothetical protein